MTRPSYSEASPHSSQTAESPKRGLAGANAELALYRAELKRRRLSPPETPKPCPFCGHAADTVSDEALGIGCGNADCPVSPWVVVYGEPLATAIAAWNCRKGESR